MVRASWVLKRQLMVAWAVLRSVTRAWTSRPNIGFACHTLRQCLKINADILTGLRGFFPQDIVHVRAVDEYGHSVRHTIS